MKSCQITAVQTAPSVTAVLRTAFQYCVLHSYVYAGVGSSSMAYLYIYSVGTADSDGASAGDGTQRHSSRTANSCSRPAANNSNTHRRSISLASCKREEWRGGKIVLLRNINMESNPRGICCLHRSRKRVGSPHPRPLLPFLLSSRFVVTKKRSRKRHY